MIRLSVISGPDTGKRATFWKTPISIGRGPGNDFPLRDGLVSQRHGEVVNGTTGVWYRDLRSRHGSLVRLNDVTVNLHDREHPQQIELAELAQVIIGETLVQIETEPADQQLDTRDSFAEFLGGRDAQRPGTAPPVGAPAANEVSSPGSGERVVARATQNVEAVTRRLVTRDPRLVSIFRLARELNTVTERDAILDLIAETTFDAFGDANFFAITVADDVDESGDARAMRPLCVRERRRDTDHGDGPMLSQSLLTQVYNTQESVLFVRDSAGIQATESIINARIAACMAAPLVAQEQVLGVMQVDTRGFGGLFGPEDLDLFSVLASYTAFALERVKLTENIYEMFEGVVKMSVAAIDARDPATAGHSERVARYTVRLAEEMGLIDEGPLADRELSREELGELRYAALLHDIGKVAVREAVLMKATRLHGAQLDAVLERIEVARASATVDACLQAIEQGRQEGLDADGIDRARRTIEADRRAFLDHAEQTIIAYQPGRPLDDDARALFQRLANQRFTDTSGRTRALLSEEELENMLIPVGTLNPREWDEMRAHAARSEDFLSQIPWSRALARIPKIAGLHHEKLDGSGYPRGIGAAEIPVQARILTIVDIFDAMTAIDREYRKAASIERAVDVLRSEAAAGMLDEALVDLFVQRVVPMIREERGAVLEAKSAE